jgi:hypothetical protein
LARRSASSSSVSQAPTWIHDTLRHDAARQQKRYPASVSSTAAGNGPAEARRLRKRAELIRGLLPPWAATTDAVVIQARAAGSDRAPPVWAAWRAIVEQSPSARAAVFGRFIDGKRSTMLSEITLSHSPFR